jgi:AraC-like DNA-binding protein
MTNQTETRRWPEAGHLRTTDVDQGFETLSSMYQRHVPTGPRSTQPFVLDISYYHLPDGGFDRFRITQRFTAASEPLPTLAVARLERGAIALESGSQHVEAAPGDTVLFPRDEGYRIDLTDCRLSVVRIDRGYVQRVAAERFALPGPLRFAGYRAASPALELHWSSTAAYVQATMIREAPAPTALVRAACWDLLVGVLLATFPNSAMVEPEGLPPRRAEPAPVRRAVAFIEENAHREITLTEIAEASGLGLRGLQSAFRHHLDSTPTAYLRRVRLERAHGDLRERTEGDTVAAIAARWGFVHGGRFAALHRATFGESPSRTLLG